MQKKIAIIGGGLAGLAAALECEAKGHHVTLFEATDRVGGKLKTDLIDGFQIDHGFQVLLPGYSEVQALNLIHKIEFRTFSQGAILITDRGRRSIAHPLDQPLKAVSSLFEDVISLQDLSALIRLAAELPWSADTETKSELSQMSTRDFLAKLGFSERMTHEFWRPFFAGIFLETELATRAHLFVYLVKTFARAAVGVPRLGIEQIPKAMVGQLKATSFRMKCRVTKRTETEVDDQGQTLSFDRVLDTTVRHQSPPFGRVGTVWLACEKSRVPMLESFGRTLVLLSRKDAEGANHFAVMSQVSESYAPDQAALVCVSSVLGPDEAFDPDRTRLGFYRSIGLNDLNTFKVVSEQVIHNAFSLVKENGVDPRDWPTQQSALQFGRSLAQQV